MKKKSIVIIAIVALACIAAIIAVIWKNAPEQKQAKQLELGKRYLEEMNYEQAKVVFEELISIAPSNVGAYLGAAKAYVGLEDYEGAVAILQKGYDQTGSEDIKAQMEEYEQKLEEQKAEAEQALREEIEEYFRTTIPIPCYETDNPIYTYSYLKKIYPEMQTTLEEYLKKVTTKTTKGYIYRILNCMALSVNDMERAKEYCKLSEVDEPFDEYGRFIGPSESKDGVVEDTYYEGSSRKKTSVLSEVDENGQTRITEWKYNSYDAEGRVLSMTLTITGSDYDTVDGGNVEDYPDYPGYLSQTTFTYHYEGNTSYVLHQENGVGGTWSDEGVKGVTSGESEYAHLSTYDDEGHLNSTEWYDEAGNLEYSYEYEYDEKWKKTALRYYDTASNLTRREEYDTAGNLTRRVEFDTEGNVISDTSY